MDDITGFIGRARDTEAALDAIGRGGNLLVTGRAGIGKSAFLRHLAKRLRDGADSPPVILVPAGTTKHVLLETARQLHTAVGLNLPVQHLPPRVAVQARRQGWLAWEAIARSVRRLPVVDTVDLIVAALHKRPLLVMLETLEVPPSQAELFARLVDATQVVAAMDETNRRVRIDRLLWRFPERLVLKPLPVPECSRLIEGWLAHHPLRFAGARTRTRFVRHVATASGGVPAAIRGMLEAARAEPEITPARARAFHHEAAARYLDMTPLVILLLVVSLALRYVSRGLGEVELLVLSGVATAVFIGLRFFMYRLRAPH
jgi:hypothetical protein